MTAFIENIGCRRHIEIRAGTLHELPAGTGGVPA